MERDEQYMSLHICVLTKLYTTFIHNITQYTHVHNTKKSRKTKKKVLGPKNTQRNQFLEQTVAS